MLEGSGTGTTKIVTNRNDMAPPANSGRFVSIISTTEANPVFNEKSGILRKRVWEATQLFATFCESISAVRAAYTYW